MSDRAPDDRGLDAALTDTLDAHGAAVWAYAEAVAPGAARQVASEAVEAARGQLPAAGKAAGSPSVARAALYHHLRLAAASAVAPEVPETHAEMLKAIARLANGELTAEDEATLRDHVAQCDDCERIAQRFTTGERLLAADPRGPVPLWLYEAASRGSGGSGRRSARPKAFAMGAGATPRRGAALAGLAALVLVFGVAMAAAGIFSGDGPADSANRPLPAATPSPTPTPLATPTPAANAAELTADQREARAAARRDRRVNLARERRALLREERSARAAQRRRAARGAARAAPAPAPAPTPEPTATATPAPTVAAPPPVVTPRRATPAPQPRRTATPRPRPRRTPAPDPPGRVAPG